MIQRYDDARRWQSDISPPREASDRRPIFPLLIALHRLPHTYYQKDTTCNDNASTLPSFVPSPPIYFSIPPAILGNDYYMMII